MNVLQFAIAHYWKIIEKLSINHFYTTPNVIRKLMSHDKGAPNSASHDHDLSSLRVIASGKNNKTLIRKASYEFKILMHGTVGECLNKEAWEWFHGRFGNHHCHLIDTWWQTGMTLPLLPLHTLFPVCVIK